MRVLCVGTGHRAPYLVSALKEANHSVAATERLDDAAWLLGVEPFDAAIALTRGAALDVSRALAARPPHVILAIVDSAGDPDSRAQALNAGADVCLGPRLDYAELDARLAALWREVARGLTGAMASNMVLSRATRCLSDESGARLALSRREYLLLERLLRGSGTAVGRDALIAYVFDDADLDATPLRRLVVELRRRIADAQIDLHIETIPRVGYRVASVRSVGDQWDVAGIQCR
jgi:two-component system, OmpR family, response regulator